MDIIAIISQYLRANRHLVVPTFGVFVAKESGGAVFSDLIKTDDGTLRSLLAGQGLGEVAAAGAIDRFIFDARYALDEEGHFDMGALGTLVKGADGVVRLVQHAVAPTTAAPQTATQSTAARQQPTQPTQPAGNRNTTTERRAQKQPKRRRGVDWFMIVAIAILLAAIAVVGYGYYCSTERAEADDAMMEELRYHTEQSAATNK